MKRVLAICAALFLVACGSANNAAAPVSAVIAAKPDVTITFDGERRTCVVALASEAQGSIVACPDVIPFMRDELKIASGSIYDTRTIGKPDETEVAKTTQNLKDAGYRFIGGH
jgi:hypothetical protein